jgi:hypothetical protein
MNPALSNGGKPRTIIRVSMRAPIYTGHAHQCERPSNSGISSSDKVSVCAGDH